MRCYSNQAFATVSLAKTHLQRREMSARKRSALPSSDESDSFLYSDSEDEELSRSPASPTGSFQSQNNSPKSPQHLLDPSSSFQSTLPSSTQGTSSFQSLPVTATFTATSTPCYSSSQSSTTRSSHQLSPSITSSLHSSFLNTSPNSPLPLPPPVFLSTSNAVVGSALPLAPDTSSFAVATTSSIAHTALQTSKFFMHTSNNINNQ